MNKTTIINMDEEFLVRGCQDNDPVAQKMVYNKYVEPMMILCLRYLINKEDAKEAMMDGFFSFYRNINGFTYQGPGSVQAWMKKIMVNQCLMFLRKRQPFAAGAKEVETYSEAAVSEDVFGKLNARDIMKLVQSLPDGYRTVFNLYSFEGKNHKEIAELLSISESTSKSQLFKAKDMLKKKIAQFN